MAMAGSDAKFVGSIPEKYDAYLGPFLFEPYAADFVQRLALREGDRVLELACGTGILTRRIAAALPRSGQLTATDLNQPMLDYARRKLLPDPRLEWRVADASKLPFPDDSFDHVVCQFGVMFFPDKPAALREALRVLKPAGELSFNVWDSPRRNSYVELADAVVAEFFPGNPPTFFQVPFGYHDQETIRSTMVEAGFAGVRVSEVALEGRSPTAMDAAVGLVEGCPLIVAIEERGVTDPRPIVEAVAKKLASAFGDAPLRCQLGVVWTAGKKP
jgi:ubiquinone/menaquinone biosynthesis C-methylase UbiE